MCYRITQIGLGYVSSLTQSCPTLCDLMDCSTPGLPVHQQLLEFTQTYVHWVGDAIQLSGVILCCPLLLSPSIFPSIRAFSNESVLWSRWPKYWSYSFNNEYSGLIYFRMDWLDLPAVQGTLKSLLQHHSSKASILWCSVFFIVQLSHPYMTTGKTIALTRRRRIRDVSLWLEFRRVLFRSKGLSRVFSNTTVWKHQFFGAQFSL